MAFVRQVALEREWNWAWSKGVEFCFDEMIKAGYRQIPSEEELSEFLSGTTYLSLEDIATWLHQWLLDGGEGDN
jgi:hypothetical protein